MIAWTIKIKQKMKNKTVKLRTSFLTLTLTGVFAAALIVVPIVRADQFDEQIQAINNDTAAKAESRAQLGAQASSLADVINKLQAEISTLQSQIADNQAKNVELQKQIVAAEEELAKQKKLLGENIKVMYLEGQISTLEILASSKDLSEFVDKQQYRDAVKDKIKTALDKVTALKAQLKAQKEELEKLIADQQAMREQLAGQQAEQNRLLNLNQTEQNELNNQIRNNNAAVATLRSQQAAENAKRFRGYTIVPGSNGRDTYPDRWRNTCQDCLVDSWGMYNRECVSYTAWKVYESGRHMPYWGGVGNANQWDDNARRAGIPVDGNPRPGDVAVAHWGYYGHTMYVDSVNANGTINISQYNWDFNGTYSEIYNFSPAGLVFIHF